MVQTLKAKADKERLKYFNDWVIDFFKREYYRETNQLEKYVIQEKFGAAMRPEVSFWNPNRSKHAEVFWLENYVFNQNTSMRNKILNAIAVKFVGMPTLTLVATDTLDYNNIIDFDKYSSDGHYRSFINGNLDSNHRKIAVWGRTQLQTSLQTAARNFCRLTDGENAPFALSHMIRWIEELDRLGLSNTVQDPNSTLSTVCSHLGTHRGIGPYFSYHPPCNFSRCKELPNIDEDEDFCLIGGGAKAGIQWVFPDVKLSNNEIMEDIIIEIKKNQYDFFEFDNDEDRRCYSENLERGGYLTTFGTEITFCQFYCFLSIKDKPALQEKRILPLTFDSFLDLTKKLSTTVKSKSLI